MTPVFGIRTLLLLVIPIALVAAVLGMAYSRGVNVFKKQGVAWALTAVMVIAAVGIGYAKSPMSGTHEPVPDYPAPTVAPVAPAAPDSAESYVWDNAHVLSDRTIQELDTRNEVLWTWYSASIGVVTCNYGGDDLYSYALQCAEDMGLGGYDMIVVLDIQGDNYWLLQGNDIRGAFTDNDCSDYAYDYMERDFAQGDYDSAVLQLTEKLGAWYGSYYG